MTLDPSRRTRVIIQSRLNSSRLPGKALLTLAGHPLIELVARRAGRSGHEVVVATSDEDYDELIVETLQACAIPVRRGSLDDVLGRFVAACADLAEEDLVIRLTGDNPLVDSDLIDGLVKATATSRHRYGRVDIDAAPEGLGAEVFTAGDLRAADAAATAAYDREHVTPWLRRHLGEYLHVPDGTPKDIHAYRATVDTLNDYVRVSRLFRGHRDPVQVGWRELMLGLEEAGAFGRLRAPRKDTTLGGAGAVHLDGSALRTSATSPAERAREAAELRRVLAAAVDHGLTDVAIDTADQTTTGALRAAAFPALAGRLSFLIRLGGPAADADPVRVEADLERTFALLGQRRCRALIAPAPQADRRVWRLLHAFVDHGVASAVGCVVADPNELSEALRRGDLGLVELDARRDDWTEDVARVLNLAARDGVRISVRLGETTLDRAGRILAEPWSASVIVPTSTTADLRTLLTFLQAGEP